MKKRGLGTAVDWMIASGIFLLYIALTFAFFRPGVQDVFDDQTLLDITETMFITETTWEITKTPIFVTPVEAKSQSDPLITLPPPLSGVIHIIDLPPELSTSYTKSELFLVDDDVNTEEELNDNTQKEAKNIIKNLQIKKQQMEILSGKPKENAVYFHVSGSDYIVLHENIQQETFAYTLFTSEETINEIDSNNPDKQTAFDTKLPTFVDDDRFDACPITEDNFEDIMSDTLIGKKKCRIAYELGGQEILRGIRLHEIDSLTLGAKNYKQLKIDYNFPELKEFKIHVYDPAHMQQPIKEFPTNMIIPSNANVFSRQRNTFVLDTEGNLIPVIVNILIW